MRNLFLMPLSHSDLNDIMKWVNDPEVVKNFQNFDRIITPEEEIEVITSLIESPYDKCFSIFRASDDAYIGQGSINQISWKNKLGRLSLFLKPEFWGQGYAQEVIELLIKRAFDEFELHKLWLMVWATNEKALHLYQKCGFEIEGILKDEYFWQDQFHDIIRMGKIRKKEGK